MCFSMQGFGTLVVQLCPPWFQISTQNSLQTCIHTHPAFELEWLNSSPNWVLCVEHCLHDQSSSYISDILLSHEVSGWWTLFSWHYSCLSWPSTTTICMVSLAPPPPPPTHQSTVAATTLLLLSCMHSLSFSLTVAQMQWYSLSQSEAFPSYFDINLPWSFSSCRQGRSKCWSHLGSFMQLRGDTKDQPNLGVSKGNWSEKLLILAVIRGGIMGT